MRVRVIGDCDSAKAVRGYLRAAGVAVVDELPGPDSAGYTLHIAETSGDAIVCDSHPSDLERHVLDILHEFLLKLRERKPPITKPEVQIIRQGGQIHGEREISLGVPQMDLLLQDVAERAIFLGLLRTMKWGTPEAPAPESTAAIAAALPPAPPPPIPPFWKRVKAVFRP